MPPDALIDTPADAPAILGSASAEQLEKINRFTPVQLPPLEAHEVCVVSFVGADNLLNRGLGKWIEADLAVLTKLLPGLPFTLDHDWGEVAKGQGLIFDARMLKSQSAPQDALNQAGNFDVNRQVVAKEGHVQVEFDVSFPMRSAALEGLRFGWLGAVSMGGFNYKDIVCPLCQTSFDDKHCPHYAPDPSWGLTADVGEGKVAPYYIRSQVFDLGEVSLVLIANLPKARVRRRGE